MATRKTRKGNPYLGLLAGDTYHVLGDDGATYSFGATCHDHAAAKARSFGVLVVSVTLPQITRHRTGEVVREAVAVLYDAPRLPDTEDTFRRVFGSAE